MIVTSCVTQSDNRIASIYRNAGGCRLAERLSRAAAQVLCVVLGVVLSAPICLAQSNDGESVAIEMRSLNKLRSGGPASIDFDLMKHSTGILKGKLSIVVSGSMGTAMTYEGDEMTLSAQRTRMRITLPNTLGPGDYDDAFDMHVSFRTANRVIDFGPRSVRVASQSERLFRVLYVTDDQRVDFEITQAVDSLSFQQFWMPSPFDAQGQQQLQQWNQLQLERQPGQVEQPPTRRIPPGQQQPRPNITSTSIFTTSEHSLVDDLPNNSLWYCNYNVVVLFADGFENIRKSQLEGLETWVKAGGSLCIEPLGILDDDHIEFLNRIKAANNPDQKVTLTPGGRIEPPNGADFENLYYDLGRVVLLFRPVDASTENAFDPKDANWRNKAVTFLWQFRRDQVPFVESTGAWIWFDHNHLGGNRYLTPEIQNDLAQLKNVPTHNGQGLFNRLMPEEVKIVPLHYIALILVFYVLTIGPLDYFVLGLFKLRRFTWITFPAATLIFTLFTVWLSNDYLSSAVERTFVSIIDVGDDGEIIRENRIELLYTGSTHDVKTSLRSSFFTPLDINQLSNGNNEYGINGFRQYDQYGSGSGRMNVPSKSIMPRISGRPPTSLEVTQTMPQWTPQMNRIFTLNCRDETAVAGVRAFDWKKERLTTNNVVDSDFQNEASAAFGSEATIACFNGRGALVDSAGHLFGNAGFLNDICMIQQGGGLFGVVSRIAPHGGGNFEDLTMLDPSNTDEYLLVIAVPSDDGLRLYRKLCRKKATPRASK